ncbi:MAG: peptidase M23, partial [Chitinophagaceae bacterium]
MLNEKTYEEVMNSSTGLLHPVVQFEEGEGAPKYIDLSVSSTIGTPEIWENPELGAKFFDDLRKKENVPFFYGGYRELRSVYNRFKHFNDRSEPRNFHLGLDIWAPAGTPLYVPWGGMVHSFKFNEEKGDYGATIILQHQISALNFYTLYGHLSLQSLSGLEAGIFLTRGVNFASIGGPEDNGQWIPHLHFQVILDIQHY